MFKKRRWEFIRSSEIESCSSLPLKHPLWLGWSCSGGALPALQVPSSLALKISRDRAFTASPGGPITGHRGFVQILLTTRGGRRRMQSEPSRGVRANLVLMGVREMLEQLVGEIAEAAPEGFCVRLSKFPLWSGFRCRWARPGVRGELSHLCPSLQPHLSWFPWDCCCRSGGMKRKICLLLHN